MSEVVRLHVPPFAPVGPTSLSALRRPLVQPEQTRCNAHCQPCATCQAAQDAAIAEAARTSADLGLRLSQLVEDALVQHTARIEARQTELVASVLAAIAPDLAQDTLRRSVAEEIAHTLSDPLRSGTLELRKSPSLDLGVLPASDRLNVVDDAQMAPDCVELREGDARTDFDIKPLVERCLSHLGKAVGAFQENEVNDD